MRPTYGGLTGVKPYESGGCTNDVQKGAPERAHLSEGPGSFCRAAWGLSRGTAAAQSLLITQGVICSIRRNRAPVSV